MAECTFCKRYKSSVDDYNYYKNKNPKRYEGYTDIFLSALVHQYFYNGELEGNNTHGTFPLNFCPECGRKLDEP